MRITLYFVLCFKYRHQFWDTKVECLTCHTVAIISEFHRTLTFINTNRRYSIDSDRTFSPHMSSYDRISILKIWHK